MRHVIVIVAVCIATRALPAQTLAVSTGVMLPVGENRGIAEAGQSVNIAIAGSTPMRNVSARLEIAYSLARSKIVRGGGARTFVVAAAATKTVPRIPFAHVVAGMGAYRSSLSPAPFFVTPSIDLGFNGGIGAAARVASRFDVLVESRLHHILSDVRPTDYLEGSVGVRVRMRRNTDAP